jgi:hypothetical protein
MKFLRWVTLCACSALIAGCGAAPTGIRSVPPAHADVALEYGAPRTSQDYEHLIGQIGEKAALKILNKHYRILTTSQPTSSGRTAKSKGRSASTIYQITSCTTTYENVSGTFDTSTDPIIGQSCSTSYVDDGAGPGNGFDGGGDFTDPCAGADDPVACYAATDKYPKYKSKAERDCEAQDGRFVTVNPGKTSDGGTRTDVGSKCVPWQMLLVDGASPVVFHQPGGCTGLEIEIAGIGIIIDAPGKPEQRSTTQVGVRVNADCSTTWVPPSS